MSEIKTACRGTSRLIEAATMTHEEYLNLHTQWAKELRAAYEALQKENEAQAKRIAELEDDNKYLKQLSFSAIDTSNQYEIKKKTLMHSLALLEKVTKHFTRVPSTLADSEIRSEVHAFLSESKNGDSK